MATHSNYLPPNLEFGSKYRKLRVYLEAHPRREWRTSFSNIESIMSSDLPATARAYNSWWANTKSGGRLSQAVAWIAAGWQTAEVDLAAETLLFRPKNRSTTLTPSILDAEWPGRDMGPWPEGLSLRREDMYEDRL